MNNKILLCLSYIVFVFSLSVNAQEKCGMKAQLNAISAQNPAFKTYVNAHRASLQEKANNYKTYKINNANKTTSFPAAVPVIFHIIIDSAQYYDLGGIAGIKQRCDSQIAVLNRDYNKQNPDSVLIPSGWKPLYANVGIDFGLALMDPSGNRAYGYELKIISTTGFTMGSYPGYIYNDYYSSAKHAATGGLDAWDVTKYMNVWCINFSDHVGLLGTTIPKYWTPSGGAPSPCPSDNEQGICIYYKALGKRASTLDIYPPNADEGRTLTHETGHLFEIWHVWGDDGGLCPWNGGYDDGLADTPPQGNNTFGNPVYTIAGGTITDTCKMDGSVETQLIGIACLDYMDYTDDAGMHLFTPDQAAVMESCLYYSGENPGLVSHWELTATIPYVEAENKIELFVSPNPANDKIYITINSSINNLLQISLVNILGQEILTQKTGNTPKDMYEINLNGMNKGIYFVKCTFANGAATRKILLQ